MNPSVLTKIIICSLVLVAGISGTSYVAGIIRESQKQVAEARVEQQADSINRGLQAEFDLSITTFIRASKIIEIDRSKEAVVANLITKELNSVDMVGILTPQPLSFKPLSNPKGLEVTAKDLSSEVCDHKLTGLTTTVIPRGKGGVWVLTPIEGNPSSYVVIIFDLQHSTDHILADADSQFEAVITDYSGTLLYQPSYNMIERNARTKMYTLVVADDYWQLYLTPIAPLQLTPAGVVTVIRVSGWALSILLISVVAYLCMYVMVKSNQLSEITKQAKDKELFLDSIIENLPSMLFVKEASSLKYVRLNRAGEKLLGFVEDEMIGKVDSELFTQKEAEFFTACDRRTLSGKEVVDIPEEAVHTATGETKIVHTKKFCIQDSNGNPAYVVGVSEDITNAKETQERYTTLFEQAAIGIAIRDTEGRCLEANRALCTILGYTVEELKNVPFHKYTHPDDFPKDWDLYQLVMKGVVPNYTIEKRYLKKDGSIIWANLTVSGVKDIITDKVEYFIAFIENITSKKQIEEENRVLTRDLELKVRERTQALEAMNKELQNFAYVASHDLQEPIRMVSSYAELVVTRYSDSLDKDAVEFLGYISEGAKRMHLLVHDLLSFSRVGKPADFKEVDLNVCLKNVLKNLEIRISETQAVITSEVLPIVQGDSVQLEQVLQNLISNAIKFSVNRPEITITTLQIGSFYQINVSDNGIGIDSKYFNKIFILFQKLNGHKYQGTGIGLAICKKIIAFHGGDLWVTSEKGKGSTFSFTLLRGESV